MSEQRPRGGVSAGRVLTVAAGVAVFAVFVWRVGPEEIWTGVRNVGWMFPVIVALGGLRFVARAWAWCLCVDPSQTLRLRDALGAVLAGDAVGNATPFGPLVGEPAKSALVRRHLPIAPALTALAIENIFYALSTAAMIAAGTIALLFAVDLEPGLRGFSQAAVVGLGLMVAVSLVLLWRQPALISRWPLLQGRPGTRAHTALGRLRQLEGEVYSFARRRRAAVVPVILLEASFHALGVVETYLAMWMILGRPPQPIDSFILETANRLVTVAFKFIPFQLGVGEVASGAVTQLLGLGATSGASLAIVRKARMGVWALVGGGLLLRLR